MNKNSAENTLNPENVTMDELQDPMSGYTSADALPASDAPTQETHGVERLNYLGEFFQCTGHQPRALMSFYMLTEDLKETLPDSLTELVALTIAAKMRNAYERVQHERLALKLGFGEEWVREVLSLEAN